HLQKNCKKNTTASTSGQADKKPGASGRVFAKNTEDHATKTSCTITEHHATIDCRSYRFIYGDIYAPEFIYHGSLPGKSMQIISALQARTLLSHGCEDVFPDELSGIPSVREMVNTRTDVDLSAAVQNVLQKLLPQIRTEIHEEFRTSSGPSDSGRNPPPVTIYTWLERFNKQNPRSFEKATAPVDAKNWIS
nr:hypothetical protein [Tanacetum cinerariifolium]